MQETVKMASHDRYDQGLTRSDLERAADNCLMQGWVKVLTEEDREADLLRWLDEPHQNWSEMPYTHGCVDFTTVGWETYVRLWEQRRGMSLEVLHRSASCYLWRMPGQVSILSMSEEVLLKEVAGVKNGTDCLVSYGLQAEHTIERVTGPYAIGLWWVKRFYQAPYGYGVDIRFSPADMHLW